MSAVTPESILDFDDFRARFALALEAAADAQDAGDLAAIESGYEELDGLLPRNADPRFHMLHVALDDELDGCLSLDEPISIEWRPGQVW